MSFREFADLRIIGLGSHTSVARYHRAWADTDRPSLPGQTVNIDRLGTFPSCDRGVNVSRPKLPGVDWEDGYSRSESQRGNDPGRTEFSETLKLTCAIHDVSRMLNELNKREYCGDFTGSRFVNPEPGWADRARVEILEQIPVWRNVIDKIEARHDGTMDELDEQIAEMLYGHAGRLS